MIKFQLRGKRKNYAPYGGLSFRAKQGGKGEGVSLYFLLKVGKTAKHEKITKIYYKRRLKNYSVACQMFSK